jgi:hypothetical protein
MQFPCSGSLLPLLWSSRCLRWRHGFSPEIKSNPTGFSNSSARNTAVLPAKLNDPRLQGLRQAARVGMTRETAALKGVMILGSAGRIPTRGESTGGGMQREAHSGGGSESLAAGASLFCVFVVNLSEAERERAVRMP